MSSESELKKRIETLNKLNELIQPPILTISSVKPDYPTDINNFIKQCVSVLLNVPISDIETSRDFNSCDARMVCIYLMRSRTELSYRKIGSLYGWNSAFEVMRKTKLMTTYYAKKHYPELIQVIDITNQLIDKKFRRNIYK